MTKKRYFVGLFKDFENEDYFVLDSMSSKIFFDNYIKGSNTKFYGVVFKIITVDVEDLGATINYLETALGFDDEANMREVAKEAWFKFDFNFKHCTEEEKKQMIASYDVQQVEQQ